jgi:long-chain acyl-CoA synthetase
MHFARETINHVLLWRIENVERDVVYYAETPEGSFVAVSPQQARRNNTGWAAALLRRDLPVGTRVAILASVRAEWVECDIGNLLARLVTIGIYPTSTPDQIAYILQHSESRVLVIGDQAEMDRCASVLGQCPKLDLIVTMDSDVDVPEGLDVEVATLEEVRREGDAALAGGDQWLLDHAAQAEPDDMITLVYTSGTTGPPKGAVLTHRNLFHVTDAVNSIFRFRDDQVGLVYLPLAHILQRYAVYQGLRFGGVGYYSSRMTALGELLPEIKPHVLAAVPRVLEKIHAKAQARVETMSPFRQQVFRWAFRIGLAVTAKERRGQTPTWWELVQRRVADRLVFRKIRARLGGNIEFIVSGGAPLAPELATWFQAAGLLVIEGYGLTETSAPATTNTPDVQRIGTVGKAIPGTVVKLDTDGEILVKGAGVFQGYFKDEAATAAAFDEDGFFRTGDIGEIDDDGFVTITDRKKDLIITAAGKNIAPANIENLLKQHRLVGQAMVHGDRRKYLTCLLSLCPEEAPLWAAEQGLEDPSLAGIAALERVQTDLEEHVQAVNARLARYESVKKWTLLPLAFEIDNGYLTPTLKLKRRTITQDFREHLDAFYADDGG